MPAHDARARPTFEGPTVEVGPRHAQLRRAARMEGATWRAVAARAAARSALAQPLRRSMLNRDDRPFLRVSDTYTLRGCVSVHDLCVACYMVGIACQRSP